MTPQLVHRYAFPVREAIEHLLGPAAGDADAWKIRVEDGELVIDIVGPAEVSFQVGDYEYTVDARRNASEAEEPPNAEPQPSPPERKGGELARRAGMLCNEGAFQVWAEVKTPEAAKLFLYRECQISSRVDLDHEDEAAQRFRALVQRYELWCNGYE